MGERTDLLKAQSRLEAAIKMRDQIERLPHEVGQKVKWKNGTIWTRVGGDQWRPGQSNELEYTSWHVSSWPWEAID